jgi:hypothetical protein
MKWNNSLFRHRIFYGTIVAVLLSWAGCFLFLMIDELRLSLLFSDYFQLRFFIAMLFYGNILIFFPTVLGGALLAYWVDRDAKKQKLSLKKAFLKGGSIGALAGIGVALYVWAFLSRRESEALPFDLYFSRTFLVGLIAFFTGGLTGRQLYYFHRNGLDIKSDENLTLE